ncbi:hypothetical protein H072_8586 [Dactylellina haptotyla CBS 200.50]|uniref:cyclin-dependent kinase n=1 Tax=Dactylellina haptotyla (strain CBS 200.50) TaxID=1284197 RepID=S8A9G0_DACHA|nr:hypothetical protein H072_8586 [Dactylellina haptotyla CBS 200.50]
MTKSKSSHDTWRPVSGKQPPGGDERPDRPKRRYRSRSPSRERKRSPLRHPSTRKRKGAVDTYIPGQSPSREPSGPSRDRERERDRDRGRGRSRERSRDRRRSVSSLRRSASPRRLSRERRSKHGDDPDNLDLTTKSEIRGKSPKRIRSISPHKSSKRSRRDPRSRSPRRRSPDSRAPPSHRHRSKRSRSRSRRRSPEDSRRSRRDSLDRRGKRNAPEDGRRHRSRSCDNDDLGPRGPRRSPGPHKPYPPSRSRRFSPGRSRSPPPYLKKKGDKRPRRRKSPVRRNLSPGSRTSVSPIPRRASTQSSDDVMSSLAKKGASENTNRDDGPKHFSKERRQSADMQSGRGEISSEIGHVPRARSRSLSPWSKRRHIPEPGPGPRDGRGRDGPGRDGPGKDGSGRDGPGREGTRPGRPTGPPYPKGPRDKEFDRRGPPSNARSRRRKQRRLADSYNGNDDRRGRSASPYRSESSIPTGPKSRDFVDEHDPPSSVSSDDSRRNAIHSREHTPDPYTNEDDVLVDPSEEKPMEQEPVSLETALEPYPESPPPPSSETRAERDAALMPPPNAPRGPRSDASTLDPSPKPAPMDASKAKIKFSILSSAPKGRLPTGPRNPEFGLMRRALGTSSNSVPVAPRKHAGATSTPNRETPQPKPAKRELPTPRVIISRKTPFHRIGLVGEGTYGQVYKAENWMTKQLVALKRVRMSSEKDGFPITAAREIKILQRLTNGKDNDKIIHLLDNMVEQNGFYMIFEYMDHDLTGVLNHPTFRLTPANIKDLAFQFFSGLKHIHHCGILHRDIKSSNILINSDGQLKIADFGLARQYDKRNVQHYTNRIITLWYRPVEILLGETQYTTGPDVWSGGCVFMELFTRKAIFPGTNEISQLDCIWHILGTPSSSSWPGWKYTAWFTMLRPEVRYDSCFMTKFSALVPQDALELAQAMFTYDPVKRPTAEQVLENPYFTNEPEMERTALKTLGGDWHELESKRNRKRERERQSASAKAAKSQP